jgi:hypothetical protein
MNTSIPFVARHLRYRTLEAVLERSVTVNRFETLIEDIRRDLGEGVPGDLSVYEPPLEWYVPGQMAKYGLADLMLVTMQVVLAEQDAGGIPLLKALGFLPAHHEAGNPAEDEDEDSLEDLMSQIQGDTTFVRLFLTSEAPGAAAGLDSLALPGDYFPRVFTVRDACVANAYSVWLYKHFYL